jgi:chromosome partitioning protein
MNVKTHKEKYLHNHLKKIENDYDFVLIDCPPNLGVLTINAIYTADLLLIPTIYSKYSLDGIADLFNTIVEVKEEQEFNYSILKNNYDSRNRNTNEFIDKELNAYKENILKTIIRKTESINQAQINEETVFTFDPKSKAFEDFTDLGKEIIGMEI